MTIKIAYFNVQSGVGTTKGYLHYLTSFWKYFLPHSQNEIVRTAEFINSEGINVITFSEIDGGSLRSEYINQVKLISNLTNLKINKFFPTYQIMGVLNQGNSINTKYPILVTKNHKLRGTGEPRYLGETMLLIDEKKVTILVTQLSLEKNNRINQIEDIANIINKMKGPIILSGDFNTEDKLELDIMNKTRLKKVVNLKTYPSWNPNKSLDYILLSEEFDVKRSYSLKSIKVSDHLPLIVEISLN